MMNSFASPFRNLSRLAANSLLLGCLIPSWAALCETPVRGDAPAAAWHAFRGDGSGTSAGPAAPAKFSAAAGLKWTADLKAQGISGPIVVAGKVYVTASSGADQSRLHVLCFDAATGKPLWERQYWATGRTMCHSKMFVATPTPASDGKRIFAFYSTNDLICLDLNGNLQWLRGLTYDYKNASNSLGMSSSPVVVGDTVIVQVENDSESFAAGLDVATGVNRWKLDRPVLANWTSPAVLTGASAADTAVLLQSGKGLLAVNPQTGKQIWNYNNACSTIPSVAVSKGRVYVPANGLTALEPAASAPKVLWSQTKLAPGTPSPVIMGDLVLSVSNAGVLNCGSAADGASAWQLRLPGTGGFSATPAASGENLFLFRENGLAIVVNVGKTAGEVVHEHDFKESILGSPAIADGALYVRSDKHLWRVSN